MKSFVVENRILTGKEVFTLHILANSAGLVCNISNVTHDDTNERYGLIREYNDHVYVMFLYYQPLEIQTILSYDQTIEYLKDKIKKRKL